MYRIFLSLYSLGYYLALVFSLPFLYFRRFRSGKRAHLKERMGRSLAPRPSCDQKAIWIHAVSVGEVKAITPLANLLHSKGFEVLISTTTETGQQVANDLFKATARVFYFPLDLPGTCRRFLDKLAPDLILLTETEFWPNFIDAASQAHIPIMVINGRISDRSYPRYRRAARLLRPVLDRIEHFCMQSRQDKERILNLGVPAEKVNWVGNLKFDYPLEKPKDNRLEELMRAPLRSFTGRDQEEQLIWLCGSTREGEEDVLLPVFLHLQEKHPGLKWILVPRHPHRCTGVKDLLESAGVRSVLRSTLPSATENQQVDCILVDTVGELLHLYPLADLVYIGGSLVPTGGQNPIEPAAFGKPILFGPHMENFREIAESFVRSYAALQVSSPEELEQRLEALIKDHNTRQWLGRNARKVIRSNQGALERTAQLIFQRVSANQPHDSESLVSTL